MSPLEIEIVLHYYYSPEDWRDGEWNEGQRGILMQMVRDDLLMPDPTSHPINLGYRPGTYKITKRGKVYVESLKSVPLPVQVWQIPTFPIG